jgi:thiol-disulfide isomerase/thioredoxin
MIAAQLSIEPALYSITTTSSSSTEPARNNLATNTEPSTHPAGAVLSVATEPSTQPTRTIAGSATKPSTQRSPSLQVNRLTIDANDWPILGSGDAQHRLVLLFDYTCPHCRREHLLLQQARQRYGNQIAFVAIPVPLEPACNPAVERAGPGNTNSCSYDRYAIAVFLADPSRFEEYHKRIMEGARPPSIEQTRQIAEKLVTPEAFAAALANPAVEKHIKASVELYREARAGQLPKLVLPTIIVHGEIAPLQRLSELLEHYLHIKPLQ